MFAQFKPINDGVLVKVEKKDTTTKGGIYIPTDAQEKNQVGSVIHAGRSEQLVAGNKVFFKKYIGHQLDEEYVVLREEDILGVIHE